MKKKNVRKSDFATSDLPKTRMSQWKDLMKGRFFTLLFLGVLLFLFFLPYLASILFRDVLLYNLSSSDLSKEEIASGTNGIILIFGAIRIPCFMVLSFGFAGVFAIIRELIYDEPVFMKEDFFAGIKGEWRPFLLISFLLGVFSFLADWLPMYMPSPYIGAIFPAFNFVFVFPVLFVSLFLSSTYSNPFFTNIRFSFSLYFHYFPSVFGTFLLCFAPYFLSYIPILLLKYILLILVLVLFLSFALLLAYENQMRIYDPLINKAQFPSYYQKGLSSYYERERKEKGGK